MLFFEDILSEKFFYKCNTDGDSVWWGSEIPLYVKKEIDNLENRITVVDEKTKMLIFTNLAKDFDEAIKRLCTRPNFTNSPKYEEYMRAYVHLLLDTKAEILSLAKRYGVKQPQQEPPKPTLLKGLQTDEAKALFQKTINAGFIEQDGEFYKWKGETKQLLAYFTERASRHLNLSIKLDKDGKITTNWKIFEAAFRTPKIKTAKNDWLKLNTKFTPNRYEEIDKLFD